MAEDWQVDEAKRLILWHYDDSEPVRKALTAGDTESRDREGHRALARLGDSVVPLIIGTICFQSKVSRHEQCITQKLVQEKRACSRRAAMCGLDRLVKISVRQCHDGPQPGVLKNAMYALVAAVWSQAQNWSHTVAAMVNLGFVLPTTGRRQFRDIADASSTRLLCRTEFGVDPRELIEPDTSSNLFRAVIPYQAQMAEGNADDELPADEEDAEEEEWDHLVRLDDYNDSAMDMEGVSLHIVATPTLISPASVESRWTSTSAGLPSDVSNGTPLTGSQRTRDNLDHHMMNRLESTYANPRIEDTPEDAASSYEDTIGANDNGSCVSGQYQGTFPDIGSLGGQLSDDTRADIEALGADYHAAISSISTKHRAMLVRLVHCIGSSSAVFSLRLVLSNIRDLHLNLSGKQSATRIAAPRSCAERIAAIDDLSACMSHFALARRMHVYMLYREALEQTGQSSDTTIRHDPFIIESGNPSPPQRGNPIHNRRAAVTRNMMAPGQSPGRVGRLRRLGQRLDIFVRKFGRGILGLLDENLSPEMIVKVSDGEFDNLVQVVDRFEGDRIRYISERSLPIVNMLFDDRGDGSIMTFRVECYDDDSIIMQEPRCSPGLAMMLLPSMNPGQPVSSITYDSRLD